MSKIAATKQDLKSALTANGFNFDDVTLDVLTDELNQFFDNTFVDVSEEAGSSEESLGRDEILEIENLIEKHFTTKDSNIYHILHANGRKLDEAQIRKILEIFRDLIDNIAEKFFPQSHPKEFSSEIEPTEKMTKAERLVASIEEAQEEGEKESMAKQLSNNVQSTPFDYSNKAKGRVIKLK